MTFTLQRVKRLLVVVLCLLATACAQTPTTTSAPASTPSSSSVDESQAVRAAFETYTGAAKAKDGATAISALASPVFGYFDNARKLALTATEQQLAAEKLSTRIMVYGLRGRSDPATLRTGSPQDVVKGAVDLGLVSQQSIANIELGEIEVSGDTAEAEVRDRGKKAPFVFRFVRENGTWKFDMMPVIDLADGAFTAVAKEKDLTPEQLVDQLLTTMYGPAKAAEVRKPIGA
jgi:hypothetical protein